MNYKRIIPSLKFRLKLLDLLEFIPDKLMLKLQYRIKTGRKLNLKTPNRYNEKLQWYKLYYRDPLMTKCADKYRVREYVASKGFKDILVPLYSVYDNANQIKFNQLPDEFVLKANNGSGSHANILCSDKSSLNINDTIETLNYWISKGTVRAGREWSYYNIKPKIICEKYLKSNSEHGLIDYKFYCFDGEPAYIKVAIDTAKDGGPKNGIFNLDFEQLPFCRKEVEKITEKIKKPKNFNRMIEIARKLSEDFPHVRVDLYNIEGNIYFGELTFYDTSGYQIFVPDEFDLILGDLFKLDKMMF